MLHTFLRLQREAGFSYAVREGGCSGVVPWDTLTSSAKNERKTRGDGHVRWWRA
jgi:hypothetical protein